MCGRYVIISEVKKIEQEFRVSANIDFSKNYNVAAGQKGLVITSEEPKLLQAYTFGFTPHWAKKPSYVINARAEGDHNKDNQPNYTGGKGIIKKPFFKTSIRKKRCLVVADAFIEGTTEQKLQRPFLVYLREKQRPFAFAGVYDEWMNANTGELLHSFAIITCPPNALMRKIPHHRMPVILQKEHYHDYLKHSTPLSEVLSYLEPFQSNKMNAFPISNDISKTKNNALHYLTPLGQPIQKEFKYEIQQRVDLYGMGEGKRKNEQYKLF